MNNNERLVVKNLEISDSAGDGIRLSNVSNAYFEGVTIRNSGGAGMVFEGVGRPPLSLAQQLGIPEDTSVELFLELLREANGAPPERRTEIVERSRLAPFLIERGINLIAFTANLTTIASHPTVMRLLNNL